MTETRGVMDNKAVKILAKEATRSGKSGNFAQRLGLRIMIN